MAKKGKDDGKEAKPAKPQPTWRAGLDFIGMLAGAIAVALVIKAYAFDVYLIPSGSMETALHGRPDGGDRIFCSKLNYRFRQPKRWEVAVFEFPYENARRTDFYNISEQYKGQNFVKRVVGLPDESLAIARGDIWTRPLGSRSEYQRLIKPDSVQRGMWLNVYEENFADLTRDELETFWRPTGDRILLDKGGALRLSPGPDSVRLDYRPLVPAGPDREFMVELSGVPDRYTLEQPVQFQCRNPRENGELCGHVYVKTIRTQNMQARCPKCGSLQNETSAVFYHRRSGLPGVGQLAVDPAFAAQGEDVPPRQSDYHIVPDLRVRTSMTLADAQAEFSIIIREDNRHVRAVFSGDGRVELLLNDQPSVASNRAVTDIKPGHRHAVEFYVADGNARVFVDSEEKPILDIPVWNDKRPAPRSLPKISGVSLAAGGGEVEIAGVTIDRDIFYYSGWESERGEKFPQMSAQGEAHIDANSFFPMGDHCPSSFDARSWGPVPLSLLRGPAILVWWPPERIGLISSP